jgi:hypothetical protein
MWAFRGGSGACWLVFLSLTGVEGDSLCAAIIIIIIPLPPLFFFLFLFLFLFAISICGVGERE